VVPQISEKLIKTFKDRIRIIDRKDFGSTFAYSSGLGLDRCLNIYGLRQLYRLRRPRLIFDFGTAVTVDLVDQKGRHRGGWIVPGPRSMGCGLHQETAQLPELVLRKRIGQNWGRSTRECLLVGQEQMLEAMVSRAEQLARQQFHQKPKLILTGGWQNLIKYPSAIHHENFWRDAFECLVLDRFEYSGG